MGSPLRRRLLPAGHKIPLQLQLVGLVLLAALASAVSTARKHAPDSESAAAVNAVSQMPASPMPPVAEGVSPVQPVEDAFEAARKGDLDTYLLQFADPLKTQLTRARIEKGDASLRNYLLRLAAPIRGIAADLNRKESVGPETISLPVQFFYADHNEVQNFQLRREDARWHILQVAPVNSAPTLIPYGTPVDQIK